MAADVVQRLREADQLGRHDLRALVQQLVEGVLAVRARLAPQDRRRVPADVLARRASRACRSTPSSAAAGRRAAARARRSRAARRPCGARAASRSRSRSRPSSTGRLARSGAPAQVLVDGAHPGQQLAEALGADREHQRQPDGARQRVAPADPVPEAEHVAAGRCRTRARARSFVETATKCRATASSPSASTTQSRAARAFSSVSIVPNVFETTTNSVRAGSRSRVACQKSLPSTFETKRTVSAGSA